MNAYTYIRNIRVLFSASVIVFILAFVFTCDGVSTAGQSPADGAATGFMSLDGEKIALRYAYVMSQPNTFDPKKIDIAVLLTEKPIPESAFNEIEELTYATRKQKNWVYYEINEKQEPIHEMIDHPATGDKRLIMSGFTHANFTARAFGKDRVAGIFQTEKPEDFMGRAYEIKAEFSGLVRQAKLPEPLPDEKTGKPLPAGGGEPGKAYNVFVKAIRDKDLTTLRKMAPSPDEDVPDSELKEMLEFMAKTTPKNQKITKGYIKGDRAVLYVTGTLEGETQYGTMEMVQKDGIWLMKNESWSNVPPKKKGK